MGMKGIMNEELFCKMGIKRQDWVKGMQTLLHMCKEDSCLCNQRLGVFSALTRVKDRKKS